MSLLFAQPIECIVHHGCHRGGLWRQASVGWQTGLRKNCDRTISHASVVSAWPPVPSAVLQLLLQYLGAWPPAHYPPCPPERIAATQRAGSGWTWQGPEVDRPVWVAGITLDAAALPVAGPRPDSIGKYSSSLEGFFLFRLIQILKLKIFAVVTRTSSWIAGGRAARNSGLTSESPGPPPIRMLADVANVEVTGGREGGLIPSWFCSTSRRMSSGSAAKKDGSTPSGRLMPVRKWQKNLIQSWMAHGYIHHQSKLKHQPARGSSSSLLVDGRGSSWIACDWLSALSLRGMVSPGDETEVELK